MCWRRCKVSPLNWLLPAKFEENHRKNNIMMLFFRIPFSWHPLLRTRYLPEQVRPQIETRPEQLMD